jgi:hypothetical protein
MTIALPRDAARFNVSRFDGLRFDVSLDDTSLGDMARLTFCVEMSPGIASSAKFRPEMPRRSVSPSDVVRA